MKIYRSKSVGTGLALSTTPTVGLAMGLRYTGGQGTLGPGPGFG
jgi:hypothetical protein